jgi:adenylosuccinate synthase
MIIDLQFGSTGKGLMAGYIAERDKPDTVVNANMPNAGHTYINDAGRTWIHKVIPNGIVSPNLKRTMIGPQSVFKIGQLCKEIDGSLDLLNNTAIIIHEGAVVLDPSHVKSEKETLSNISSTMQGSAAAAISKMHRDYNNNHRVGNNTFMVNVIEHYNAKGIQIQIVTNAEWTRHLLESKRILAEGAQGYSLGINAGFWPYCTSRDCTPARFLADMGIPHKMLDKVIGTARVHPIRVGNTHDGHSGGHYSDQIELSWDQFDVVPETTTVTGRVRRIFSFSFNQMDEAIAACCPDEIFLNFCNYDKETAKMLTHSYPQIVYKGWGPQRHHIEVV